MAKNELLPFADGEDANVLPTNQWEALTDILENGFQSGIARSEQVNRVLAQGAVASYVLGQLIVDQLNKDATLNKDTLYQNLVSALQENAKDACLPLAGGTMTGSINFSVPVVINQTTDTSYTTIRGGTTNSDGARLVLCSKGDIDVGQFKLCAHDGTNSKNLVGDPDGTLTWGGQTLFPSFSYGSKTRLAIDTTHTMASDGLIFVEVQRAGSQGGALETFINGAIMWLSSNDYSFAYGYYFVKQGDTVRAVNKSGALTLADVYFIPVRY